MKRIVSTLGNLHWGKPACAAFALCAAAMALPAQTLTTLLSFDGANGSEPLAGLVQATDGNFYGATADGGAHSNPDCVNNCGTVFKITPSGTLTTLYSFCAESGCADGTTPSAGLLQAPNGDFYGTTLNKGANANGGTVFKITPSGTLTTLYSFCSTSGCADGNGPAAPLIRAADGNFYGTTIFGGLNTYGGTGGTVFAISPSGTLTTLYSFCSKNGCADGSGSEAGLVQAADGNFYGTTLYGGANGDGTVFKITPGGKLTTLHSFDGTDGSTPAPWALVQSANGDFYGTTYGGGANGDGTVFKITPGGKLTTLYSFDGTDGSIPSALVQATNGDFYGTTVYGGPHNDCFTSSGCGTVFKMTPSGTLTTLHSLDFAEGYNSDALIQGTDGNLYGTAADGGANSCLINRNNVGCGTVFSLFVGLGPFVETQTASGKVGAAVKILGTDLTGATSVTFNGTAAVFDVASSSLITTTVPDGATTGTVEVVTPGGTLKSNVPFRVSQ